MNRRAFLRNIALIGGGVVAADQLELLDRLGWVRTMFPSAGLQSGRAPLAMDTELVAAQTMPAIFTKSDWDRLLRENYIIQDIVELVNASSPSRTNRDRVNDWRGNG